MMDRYFSETPLTDSIAILTGSEAHHLLHVMRAKVGEKLIVFDGTGGQFEAAISRCGRSEIEIELGEHQAVERELDFQLTLAVALPKGDRQRWMVEKAVEMGVTNLVPLKTERSVAKLQSPDKLQRYVIEASKQCGRNRLLQIEPQADWQEYSQNCPAQRRLLAHPGGGKLSVVEKTDTCIAIGPEGGFTDAEVEQVIAANWEAIDLGSRILRIETAAIALSSAIIFGDGKASHGTS